MLTKHYSVYTIQERCFRKDACFFFIQMYKNSKGFIITQNPLPSTIVDFYRMLYEKDVKVIVSFDDENSTEVISHCILKNLLGDI